MRKLINTLTLASVVATVALAAGCTKNYYYNECPGSGGDQNRITLSSEVHFGQTPRVQDEQIVAGQSLSLFVTNTGSTATGDQLYQNNRITADGIGGFTYRVPMFYPSDGTHVDFYAVHPYYTDAELTTAFPFTVQTDQTQLDGYLSSDLLFGTEANVQPQVNAIPLTFYHKLTKLDFIITSSDADIDLTGLNSISVLGTLPETTINPSTGAITAASGTAAPVLAYNDPVSSSVSPSRVEGFTVIIVPQTVPGATALFRLDVEGNSSSPFFFTPSGNYNFQTGKKYTVTLDMTTLTIDLSGSQIDDWENGGSIGGPAGPQ